MYQYNNNNNYMIQNDMHQYIMISIVQYEITCTNINIKYMIQNMKQKKEIKTKNKLTNYIYNYINVL